MHRWSDEDLFIYEFVKCLYGSGDADLLQKLLSRCGVDRAAGRAAQMEMGAFFYDAAASGKAPLDLPQHVLREWKQEANRNAVLNMICEEEGGKVVRELNQRGIDCA